MSGVLPHAVTIRTGSTIFYVVRGVTSGSKGCHDLVRLPFHLWPISIYVAEPSRVSGSLFRVSHFRQNSREGRGQAA